MAAGQRTASRFSSRRSGPLGRALSRETAKKSQICEGGGSRAFRRAVRQVGVSCGANVIPDQGGYAQLRSKRDTQHLRYGLPVLPILSRGWAGSGKTWRERPSAELVICRLSREPEAEKRSKFDFGF